MENVNVKAEDLKKLMIDVAQIKAILLAQKEEKEMDEVEDENVLKEMFGTFKTKKSAEQIMKETRKELESKWTK